MWCLWLWNQVVMEWYSLVVFRCISGDLLVGVMMMIDFVSLFVFSEWLINFFILCLCFLISLIIMILVLVWWVIIFSSMFFLMLLFVISLMCWFLLMVSRLLIVFMFMFSGLFIEWWVKGLIEGGNGGRRLLLFRWFLLFSGLLRLFIMWFN